MKISESFGNRANHVNLIPNRDYVVSKRNTSGLEISDHQNQTETLKTQKITRQTFAGVSPKMMERQIKET